MRANLSDASNGLSAVRSSVAGVRERAVRSTRPAEAVAELGALGHMEHFMKARAINILAMVALIALQFLVGCSENRPLSHSDLKQRAEAAIKDAGGADALEKEAKFVLSNFQEGSDWQTNCPAITKLHSMLSPDGHYPWLRADQEMLRALPAHVVVRFGSHAHYAYVWIFDPAQVPLGKIEEVEHLDGAVYLSEQNL